MIVLEKAEYISFDEFEDVLASLLLVRRMIKGVGQSKGLWKWVLLGTHSALQGACVSILTNTDGSGALEKKAEINLRKYHNFNSQKAIVEKLGGQWVMGGMDFPEARLANLPDLLSRLPNDIKINHLSDPSQLEKGTMAHDLYILHDFRNRFTHFESVSWSIQEEGLPRIIKNSIRKVEQIVKYPNYPRYNRFTETDALNTISEILHLVEQL